MASAARFAHAVSLSVADHVPSDNYFNLPPNGVRVVALRPTIAAARAPAGTVTALNTRSVMPIRLKS